MTTIKEVRCFTGMEEIRNLCIKKGWYKKGNSADYDYMLSKCVGLASFSDIEEIARDIFEHSDIDYYDFDYNCADEYIASMMTDLVNFCTYTYFDCI